ncbi:hypothetical protein [Streptomyces sp. NPDC101166]|uniref:hypothetical protein n=1 Tax=Streptomyces sp. NPDC101166 TaxID=3366120 RepID=UPI00381EBD4E
MACVPATAGAPVGTALGGVVAPSLLHQIFQGAKLGTAAEQSTIDARAYATVALGMPLTVLLAAPIPAMRAHRLSAARAVSGGSAPHSELGPAVQRWLTGVRLPRSVTLGLRLPSANVA